MASAPQQKHSEGEFGNWVKCCIGLRYFKDGLKPFVDSEIEHQHRSIVKTIFRQFETALVHCEQSHEQPGKCVSHNIKVNCDTCSQSHCASRLSQHAGPCSFKQCGRCKDNFCRNCKLSTHVMADCDCTVKSILPAHDKDSCQYKTCNCKKPHSRNTKLCKNNWCGHFYNEVQNLHMFGDPLFANSNTQVWKKNPWEFAKCFLNCGGQLTTQSSDDIDAAGLISICRNNKYFQTRLNDLRRLDEVREFRNVVFHSATQSVTEEDKCKFVDTIICILEGETCLKDTLAAKKACGKVKHLNTLKIQIEDPLVVNARSEAIQAILQDQREIQACIAELRESSHSSDKERIETLQQNLFEFGNLLGRHALELSTVKREIQVIQTDLHHTKKRLTDVEEQLGAALLFIEDIQNRCPDVNGIKSNTRIIVEADQTTVTAEQSRHISDVLLEDCQRFIKKDSKTLKPSSGLNTREFYTDVEDGGHAKIKDAKNKCLSLEIQCFTVESFIKLLKKCVSGALTQRFKPIRDELRKLTQCSKLEMEVFIYEEDAIATLEQIDIEQQCLLENDKGLVQYQSSIAKPTEIKSDQAITKKEAENVTQEDVHRTTFENCEQDENKRTRKCSGTEEAHASYKECVKQHKTELSLFEQLKKTDVKETDDRCTYPSILREACAHHPAKLVEMYYKIHNQVESDTGMAEKHKELLLLACCKLASGDDEVPDVEFSSEEYNGHFCYVCERKTIKKAAGTLLCVVSRLLLPKMCENTL